MVAWAVTQTLGYRDALWWAVTGDKFNGTQAANMKLVNKAVPLADLRNTVMELARKLEAKSPAALRYTKEAMRAVRTMTREQALDYLDCKQDALRANDQEMAGRKRWLSSWMRNLTSLV